jgi:hypothetical protein
VQNPAVMRESGIIAEPLYTKETIDGDGDRDRAAMLA